MSYTFFDSHCDTATEIWRRRENIGSTTCMVNTSKVDVYDGYAQFFAFCTYAGLNLGYSCEQLLKLPYEYFMEQISRSHRKMRLCGSGVDYDAAMENGEVAAFLSLEGAEGIACDPGRLEELRQKGFSMINLTWNANNPLAGCSAKDGPGLSECGKEFVRRAQMLGFLIDVSHVSDRAFWDIINITQKPVVASHSNSRSICRHHRNLTDDQFRAICDTGGYVGINLYADFLTQKKDASFEDIYIHMDHFLSLSGGDSVALGGDLDGCDHLPKEFSSIRDYKKLFDYLEKKNLNLTK